MIVVEGLRKRYKRSIAVDGLSLEIPESRITGLVGPNGAGKTTTIKCILGLVRPDSGKILVDGVDVVRSEEAKGKLGYTPETPEAPSWLTSCELLETLARLDGLGPHEARPAARRALERLGVDDLCNRRLGELSKGQRKRVLIAQVLLSDKKYVLMDEPFTGLDPEWVAGVRKIILELRSEGRGVLVSSHILKELEEIIDQVVIIRKGKTMFQGTLEELSEKVAGERILLLKAKDPAKAANIVRERGLLRHVEVTSTSVKGILAGDADPSEIVKELVMNGVEILGFEVRGVSLEEAYMRLAGIKR
ncbi:MAG: ABC transporter ATP-binding protein [Desulfurococcales archaeon]|nr:ABC transporter ATP-binding protein [Desulfurococcales archaeon]